MMTFLLMMQQLLLVPADWAKPVLFVAMMTMMLTMMMTLLVDLPASPPQTMTQFQRLLQQVDELVNIMRSNVIVWKRKGTRVRGFHGKLDQLSKISRAFKLRAKRFHHIIWWKHNRMKTILQLEIGILFAIVSVTMATHTSGGSSNFTMKSTGNDLIGASNGLNRPPQVNPTANVIDNQSHMTARTHDTRQDQHTFEDKLRESSPEQYICEDKFRDTLGD